MDILDEIQDDVRRANFQKLIKKYYKAIVALFVIASIAVSSCMLLRHNRITKQQNMARQYYELFLSDKTQGPLTDSAIGELIQFSQSIFMPFAELQYINRAINNKQYDRAAELLLDIIGTKKIPLELSNAARIKLAELVMAQDMGEYYSKVVDILTKATKSTDAPYVYIMRLLRGQLLIESNKVDEGLVLLKELNKDASAPEGVRFFCAVIISNYLR